MIALATTATTMVDPYTASSNLTVESSNQFLHGARYQKTALTKAPISGNA